MARLLVRSFEDYLIERLRARSRRHHRSLEAELREILRDVARAKKQSGGGLGSNIAASFKGLGLKDGDIRELRGYTAKPATFHD
jgi:plasmid stability protein